MHRGDLDREEEKERKRKGRRRVVGSVRIQWISLRGSGEAVL
jgi:hypothetical protein